MKASQDLDRQITAPTPSAEAAQLVAEIDQAKQVPDLLGDLDRSIKAARANKAAVPAHSGAVEQLTTSVDPPPALVVENSKKRPPKAKPHGLKFNPGNHRYTLDGEHVPGVTTILGVLNKEAIPKWAAKTVAEYVAENPDAVETLRTLGNTALVNALKEIPWKKRDDAGTRGNVLHDYAEALLNGEEIDVEEEHIGVMESALDFMDDWSIEPLLIEAACASREHKWAGTLDLIAKFKHPATGQEGVAIFDWKSGKAMYPEYAWQFNAYAHAEFHGLNGDEHPIPECCAAFGVQIRADGYDVAPFAFGRQIYNEFLTIRRTFDIAKRGRGDWKTPGSGYVGAFIQRGAAA